MYIGLYKTGQEQMRYPQLGTKLFFFNANSAKKIIVLSTSMAALLPGSRLKIPFKWENKFSSCPIYGSSNIKFYVILLTYSYEDILGRYYIEKKQIDHLHPYISSLSSLTLHFLHFLLSIIRNKLFTTLRNSASLLNPYARVKKEDGGYRELKFISSSTNAPPPPLTPRFSLHSKLFQIQNKRFF